VCCEGMTAAVEEGDVLLDAGMVCISISYIPASTFLSLRVSSHSTENYPSFAKYGFGNWPGGLARDAFNASKLEPYTGHLEGKDYLEDIQAAHAATGSAVRDRYPGTDHLSLFSSAFIILTNWIRSSGVTFMGLTSRRRWQLSGIMALRKLGDRS
jgi:hypothetical protein